MVEAVGFGPRSDYVEYCWLPVLGPSATWCFRRLATVATANPARLVVVDLVDLSLCLGLGPGLGRSGQLARTLRRLGHFGVVSVAGESLAIRRKLAPLSGRQLGGLSLTARGVHNYLTCQPEPAA